MTQHDRVRLMFAIGGLGQGGSERQLTELVLRLSAERFDPVVVINRNEAAGENVRRIQAANIPILTLGHRRGGVTRRWAWAAYRYMNLLRTLRPDVVYAWLDETAAFLAPISRGMDIPCLIARRNTTGSVRERKHPWLGSLARRAETQALLVTANSGAVARDSVARGHRSDRVRVVPNGHEELPPLAEPPSGVITFGYVAQFRPDKGHHRLVDVLERLRGSGWRVDFAGDGPLRPEIEQRIARAELNDRVRFLGLVADIRAFWRHRHAALLLSDSEGSPNALLEASFAGRPAIATDSGGIPEVVDGGGILVPADDPESIAQAMLQLINNADVRARLGQKGWSHVAERHSMNGMVQGHIRVIEETLELAAED